MAFTWTPHKHIIDARTGIPGVQRFADYMILGNGSERVYVQQGHVYMGDTEHPTPKEDIPQWFWDQYARMSPDARAAVGLPLPEDEAAEQKRQLLALAEQLRALPPELRRELLGAPTVPLEAPRIDEKAPKISGQYEDESWETDGLKNDPEAPAPKMWTCDVCMDTIPLRSRGVHTMAHKKEMEYERKRQEATAQAHAILTSDEEATAEDVV